MAFKEFTGELDSVEPQSTGSKVQEFTGKLDQEKPGFWDQNPNARTGMRIGLPLALTVGAELAATPITGGMSGLAALGTLAAAGGLGSLGGEAINQAIGVNPIDFREQALAALFPGVGRAAGGVVSGIAKTLTPGFGEAAKAAITPEMRALSAKLLKPGTPAKDLYTALSTQGDINTRITKLPGTKQAIDDLSQEINLLPWGELRKKAQAEGMENLFGQIEHTITGAPGVAQGLTFAEMDAANKVLGKLTRSTTDPVLRGQYQQLQKGILTDMENAPMPSGGVTKELWTAARSAAKREHAEFELAKATEQAITTHPGVDVVDPNKIVKWLRTTGKKEIGERVGPQEYRKILNEYRLWASTVGHNTGRATGAALGAAISHLAEGPGGVFSGAPAGWIAAELLAKGMMTESGRKMVRITLGNPSTSNFRRLASAMGATTAAVSDFSDVKGENP